MSLKEMLSRIKGDHALMMLVCCLVPLLLLAAAWYLGVDRGIVSFGFLLLCPLLHFFLMKDPHKPEAKAGPGGEEKKCY